MRVKQIIIGKAADLATTLGSPSDFAADLLLVFGGIEHFTLPGLSELLRCTFPDAMVLGCSTAGEITADGVNDGTCTITAIKFDQTRLAQGSTCLSGMDDSFAAGERLGKQIAAPGLKAVLVFGPGVQINGSALVNGMASIIGAGIPITGGLAGDGGAFKETFTIGADGVVHNQVVAVGLSGDGLRFGHGSFGGWEPFGPARKVTRCRRRYEGTRPHSAVAVARRRRPWLGVESRSMVGMTRPVRARPGPAQDRRQWRRAGRPSHDRAAPAVRPAAGRRQATPWP